MSSLRHFGEPGGYRENVERELATEETTVALWRLGRYVLHEKIGAGGMGVVHRAVDADGHEVAIKLLQPQVADDGESRERFAREVRALSRVRGHHVAEVLDADIAASTPYLVTRHVAGASLHDVVSADGPLRGPALEALAADLIDALTSIHDAGIVHRDLKPANVLVCGGEAYVIDFGIAQIGDDTRLTVPGMVFGTPGFLPPELLSGGDIGPAGDVFAWGATVAFAATGRPPFGSGRFDVVSYAVVHKEPVLIGVPGWLAAMLRRAMAKDPAERPTVTELRGWAAAVSIDAESDGGTDASLGTGERVFDWATDAAADWSDPDTEPDTDPEPDIEPDASRPPATARLPVAQPTASPIQPPIPGRAEPIPTDPTDVRTAQPSPAGTADRRDAPDDGWPSEAAHEVPPEADEQALGAAGEKHPLVGSLLLLAITAAAVVFPVAAGLAVLLWLVLARTIDRSASALENRRALHGRRARDVLVAVSALPWHALRSLGITAIVLAVASVGAGVIVGFAALFAYASSIVLPLELVYAGALLAVALFCLRGFQPEPVQRGTRRILGKLASAREVGVTIGLLLTAGIVTFVALAVVGEVSYWPLDTVGFERESLVDAWRSVIVAE